MTGGEEVEVTGVQELTEVVRRAGARAVMRTGASRDRITGENTPDPGHQTEGDLLQEAGEEVEGAPGDVQHPELGTTIQDQEIISLANLEMLIL